ncbi:hypothetical protein K523DRAFT_400770 [Schizophyllum commune Tattone D]|nr:hypothetical protein K523DRAFT_400770 [Schizophyllum commune Tattone D]
MMFRPSFIRRLISENLARASATAIQRGHEGSSSVDDPPPGPLLRPVDLPAVSPSGDGPFHERSSCAVPPSRADASADLPPLGRSPPHPRPEETSSGPSRDSHSHEPPAPVTSHGITSRLAGWNLRSAPAPRGTSAYSPFLNIYSRNMLPISSSAAPQAPTPDTQWAGHDKEVINVMIPVYLYDCFVILLSAPRLRRIQFWRILAAGSSSHNWHDIQVPMLESLIIRDTETQIKDLLTHLYFENLNHLEVYYSPARRRKFQDDQTAYYNLFSSRRHLAEEGDVLILPNDSV